MAAEHDGVQQRIEGQGRGSGLFGLVVSPAQRDRLGRQRMAQEPGYPSLVGGSALHREAAYGQTGAAGSAGSGSRNPDTFVFAAVPSEESDSLKAGFDPIIAMIEKETGKKIEFQKRDRLRRSDRGDAELVTGVAPQVAPAFVATALHRFDINLRVSVVLGFVGVGGIGFEIAQSLRQLDYPRALALALIVVLLCVAVELISGALRRALLGGPTIEAGAFSGLNGVIRRSVTPLSLLNEPASMVGDGARMRAGGVQRGGGGDRCWLGVGGRDLAVPDR